MEDQKNFRQNIGAFWLRNDRRGGHFLKGCVTIDGVNHELILFTNTAKNRAEQPDYVVRPQIDAKTKKYAKDHDREGARA